MAGGGQLPGSIAVNQTNAEIYSPPYLFKGAAADDHRPRPPSAAYGVELRRHDAGRRADREGLADPARRPSRTRSTRTSASSS